MLLSTLVKVLVLVCNCFPVVVLGSQPTDLSFRISFSVIPLCGVTAEGEDGFDFFLSGSAAPSCSQVLQDCGKIYLAKLNCAKSSGCQQSS